MKLKRSKRFLYIMMSCALIFGNTGTALATTTDTPAATESTPEITSETPATESSTVDWPEGPSVSSGAAIVMEASSGLVLYEKNIYESHYPASITKILSSLIAIENSSLSETVTFSHDAIFNVEGSRVGFYDVGEETTVENCLYGIMLASGNEVTYALAEHVGGTIENFVDMMNEKAEELGCVNSHFANPHGLQNTDHWTCAYDMALISRAAIKNSTFAKITGTRTYTIPPTNMVDESRPLANHHKFIKGDIYYEGAIGGKTGYTDAAGNTLVTYAERDGMLLICVVMASGATTQYEDTAALLDYGFDNFSKYDVSGSGLTDLSEESPFFTKYSSILSSNDGLLTIGGDGSIVLPNSASIDDAKREVSYNQISSLAEGENIIGTLSYTYDGKTVGTMDIIYNNTSDSELPTSISSVLDSNRVVNSTTSPLTDSSTSSKKKNLRPVIITVILVIVALFVFLYYLVVERPRIRRRKAYYRKRKNRKYD